MAAVTGLSRSPLVADIVVSFFQFLEVEFLSAAVGEFDRGLFRFVRIDFFLFAGLGGRAIARLPLVGQRVHIRTAVGKDALHREQPRAGVVEFLACFVACRFRILIGLFVVRGVLRVVLDRVL